MFDNDGGVGGPPIPVLVDEKSINDFLTLKQGMKVALLICDDIGSRCARLGVINKCSTRGIWCGFLIPHSFFDIVTITTVKPSIESRLHIVRNQHLIHLVPRLIIGFFGVDIKLGL